MENFINIGEIKRKSILKGFVNLGESEDIEKAKSGVYTDDAENRKLNRVGQHYGSKKQEDSKGDKSPAKKEDEAPEDSKPSLEDHAKSTDSEVLKKVVANEKSDPALVAAAKRELTARGETHAHNTPEENVEKNPNEDRKTKEQKAARVQKELDKLDDGDKLEKLTKRIYGLEDDIINLKRELKLKISDRAQIEVDMEQEVVDDEKGNEYGEKLNKIDSEISEIRSKINKTEEDYYNAEVEHALQWLKVNKVKAPQRVL